MRIYVLEQLPWKRPGTQRLLGVSNLDIRLPATKIRAPPVFRISLKAYINHALLAITAKLAFCSLIALYSTSSAIILTRNPEIGTTEKQNTLRYGHCLRKFLIFVRILVLCQLYELQFLQCRMRTLYPSDAVN